MADCGWITWTIFPANGFLVLLEQFIAHLIIYNLPTDTPILCVSVGPGWYMVGDNIVRSRHS